MNDRMSAHYHRLMSEQRYRARAEKSRKKPLEKRVAGLACKAMLFGFFMLATSVVMGRPFGFLFALVFAVAAAYSVTGFLIDSTILTMDLRELEADKRANLAADADVAPAT